MRRVMFFAIVSLIVTLALPSTRASQLNAQSIGDSTRTSLISINPIGVLFEYYSGEFEHAFSKSGSVALAASYFSPYDIVYTSADLIVRYYPAEQSLRGFSIGPSVGYTHINSNCFDFCRSEATNAFTVGIQLDYSWILGRSQHFGVEAGVGAKRLFYQGSNTRASDALPTGRLSVGYAF